MIYLFCFLIGLIFGSFLNVIIYRIPKNQSIISPRSYCPKCKSKISFYNNIPLISFLIQNGKCKKCKKSISLVYPFTELITGFLFLIGFFYFEGIESFTFITVSSLLFAISIIDYRHFIIPLKLSLFLIILILPNLFFLAKPLFYIYGLLVGLGYLLFIYIITWIITKKEPLGLGDIQLICILGLWLGPIKVLMTIFLSACIGIIYWLLLYFINGYEKNKKLPLGTFLSISSILVYLY